jgi:polyisoprenoid-binding protein YceI
MKTNLFITTILSIFVFSLSSVFLFPTFAAESYKVDPVHSYIVFRIKHLGVGYSFGRFNDTAGSFVFNDSSPSSSSIELQVKSSTIDTFVEKRDEHLKSPDFFNAAQYPLISFKSKSVKKLDNENYEVTGDLTLLGTTRPITVKALHTGSGKDPWGKFRRGFETVFTIKRSEFGMDFMLSGLSDEVELTVSIEGIRE